MGSVFFSNISSCKLMRTSLKFHDFLDNLFKEFTNNELFALRDIICWQISTIEAMIETWFSEKYFSNISINNCSSSYENIINIMNSLPSKFDFISIYNCTSGFLTMVNSNISLSNSIFDNSFFNYTLKKSVIILQGISHNNITIFKCLFNHIHSISLGGVIFT